MNDNDEKYSLIETGGSSIVKYKTLYSKDSKYLLCPCGNVVKVLVVQTGECIQKLIGHKNEVTGVCHHPKIKLQIFSISLDSSVKLWDYEDGIELANFDFDFPLYGIFSNFQSPGDNLIFFVQKTSKKVFKDMEVCSFNFEQKTSEKPGKTDFDVVTKFQSPYHQIEKVISFSKSFFAIQHSRSFTVYYKDKNDLFKKIRYELKEEDEDIVCLVCHPTENRIVTGHMSGKICFWFEIFDPKNIVADTQHWHASKVHTLCFTPGGHSLLSGGCEGVLVQWKDNQRHFLPRLGAPIDWISVANDNSYYSTSHVDNSILVITNYFTVLQSFEGFASSTDSLPCGFKYDHMTGACVTNGKLGHLLFYLPQSDTQLYNLDVVEKNYVYPMNPKSSKTTITAVAFSKSKKLDYFMATMERDSVCIWDQKLKFWKFDETEKGWSLNTVVVSPHKTSKVTSLNFHPTENYFVSTDADGFAKTWSQSENGWESESVLTYKNEPCFDSSFSQDGSLLALVFGHVITLCDPLLSDNLTIFASCQSQIKSVKFGNFECCHNLVILTTESLESWDIISGDLLWLIPVTNGSFIKSDAFSSNMALFEGKKADHLYIFQPNKKLPTFSYQLPIAPISAEFIPSESGSKWSNQSELYIVSSKMSVHTFASGEDFKKNGLHLRTNIKSKLDAPIVELLSTKTNLIENKLNNKSSISVGANKNALNTFEVTPCHMMSSMSQICDDFLTTLLMNSSE